MTLYTLLYHTIYYTTYSTILNYVVPVLCQKVIQHSCERPLGVPQCSAVGDAHPLVQHYIVQDAGIQ